LVGLGSQVEHASPPAKRLLRESFPATKSGRLPGCACSVARVRRRETVASASRNAARSARAVQGAHSTGRTRRAGRHRDVGAALPPGRFEAMYRLSPSGDWIGQRSRARTCADRRGSPSLILCARLNAEKWGPAVAASASPVSTPTTSANTRPETESRGTGAGYPLRFQLQISPLLAVRRVCRDDQRS
jgi:hypothetical protein